jgi:hypothetical protein
MSEKQSQIQRGARRPMISPRCLTVGNVLVLDPKGELVPASNGDVLRLRRQSPPLETVAAMCRASTQDNPAIWALPAVWPARSVKE